jgi:hypothetical protein
LLFFISAVQGQARETGKKERTEKEGEGGRESKIAKTVRKRGVGKYQ